MPHPCPICSNELTEDPACEKCTTKMDLRLRGLMKRFKAAEAHDHIEKQQRADEQETMDIINANARPAQEAPAKPFFFRPAQWLKRRI